MSNLFYESLELTEDTAYQEIYTDLSVKTEGWESPFGEVRYSDKTDADIAVSILKDRYANVKLEPLDFKDGDDLSFHITYSDDKVLDSEDVEEEFDPNGLNWLEDKNPAGTPLGNGTGMGEDYEPGNESIECPHCGGQAEYLEGQGNFRFYKCIDCGDYLFKNRKGLVKPADDAFDSEGNLLSEELNEGDGDAELAAAQAHYDSLRTDEQKDTIKNLENKFSELGFETIHIEQLLPEENSDVNMHYSAINKTPDKEADEYSYEIVELLKENGASNIEAHYEDLRNNWVKVYGYFYLDSMNFIQEAIEKHDELNQKIFDGDELDSKVKDKLLEIADKFKENLANDDVKLDIKDAVIVGSSASYNYTKDSDIDLHLVADLSVYPNQEELAEKLYNAYKSLFNDKFDPTIYGIPVELFVEPEGAKTNSKGRYSLYNGWVQMPEKEEIPEMPDITSEYKEYESKAKACDTIEAIDNFIDDVYKLRQNSLLTDGEFGKGNLIFKELRNNNILKDLKDKKVELENKDMSLEENKIELKANFNEDYDSNFENLLNTIKNKYTCNEISRKPYYCELVVPRSDTSKQVANNIANFVRRNGYKVQINSFRGRYTIRIHTTTEKFSFKDYINSLPTPHKRLDIIVGDIDMFFSSKMPKEDIIKQLGQERIDWLDSHNILHNWSSKDSVKLFYKANPQWAKLSNIDYSGARKVSSNDLIFDEAIIEEASEEDNRAKALADYLDISVEAVDPDEDNIYETPEGDYLVLTEDEAYRLADEEVKAIFDDMGLEAFTPSFQEYILANCFDDYVIDQYIEEEIDYYANQEQDENMVDYLSNLDNLEAIDYIKDSLGSEKAFNKWVIENDAIDVDKVAEEAINEDGVAHFIARYNGDEIDLGNDLFAYRVE